MDNKDCNESTTCSNFAGPDRRQEDSYLRQEFKELHLELSAMKDIKQDKISPIFLFTLLVYLITTTFGGAWWAATISSELNNLTHVVEISSTSRYTKYDADADFKQRDQRLNYMQKQIEANSIMLKELGKK